MGGVGKRKPPQGAGAVRTYLRAVTDERRALFDRLESMILELYPEAEAGIAYGVPTYWAKSGRVGLGFWSQGVSFYPYGGSYLDEFRARHPSIQTGKGTINFKLTDRLPIAGLRQVIRRSIENPTHRPGPRPSVAKGARK